MGSAQTTVHHTHLQYPELPYLSRPVRPVGVPRVAVSVVVTVAVRVLRALRGAGQSSRVAAGEGILKNFFCF